MANNQLILTLHTYVEAQNLISSLRADDVTVPDDEARQPDQIMDALYGRLIDVKEALDLLNRLAARLKAVAEREATNG